MAQYREISSQEWRSRPQFLSIRQRTMRCRLPLVWASAVPADRGKDPQTVGEISQAVLAGSARLVARVRKRGPLAFGKRSGLSRFAPKRRAGSVSGDRGGECVAFVWLLGGTASADLNAELLHPRVKRRPLHSQPCGSAIRACNHPVGFLERSNDVSTLCLVEHRLHVLLSPRTRCRRLPRPTRQLA